MSRITGVLIFMCGLCWSSAVYASAMVERHIFSPELEETKKKETKTLDESPEIKKLKRKLSFTGVVIAPRAKYALIKDKSVRKGMQGKSLHMEGDEIGGMTIKEIGSNFLLLSGKDGDLRLGLYEGKKSRPAPPAEPKPDPDASNEKSVKERKQALIDKVNKAGKSGKSTKPGKSAKKAPGFIKPGASKGAAGKASGAGNASSSDSGDVSSGSNPFLDAMKRAKERQDAGGGTSSGGTNPFLDAFKRTEGN